LTNSQKMQKSAPKLLGDILCPICGSSTSIRKSKYGQFYGCNYFFTNGCQGTISIKNGLPINIGNDYSTKQARLDVKNHINHLVVNNIIQRNQVLNWISFVLCCDKQDVWLDKLTIEQCELILSKAT